MTTPILTSSPVRSLSAPLINIVTSPLGKRVQLLLVMSYTTSLVSMVAGYCIGCLSLILLGAIFLALNITIAYHLHSYKPLPIIPSPQDNRVLSSETLTDTTYTFEGDGAPLVAASAAAPVLGPSLSPLYQSTEFKKA